MINFHSTDTSVSVEFFMYAAAKKAPEYSGTFRVNGLFLFGLVHELPQRIHGFLTLLHL